jgi:hypothetical protein
VAARQEARLGTESLQQRESVLDARGSLVVKRCGDLQQTLSSTRSFAVYRRVVNSN